MVSNKKDAIKIKITRSRVFAAILLLISLAFLFRYFPELLKWYEATKPLKKIIYYNLPLEFRADLKLAKNIKVYPSESIIRDIFWNNSLRRITIAVLNSTNETHYIGVEAYEIAFKLGLFYTLKGYFVEIKGQEVNNVSELKGNITHPIIYIIPPVLSNNETIVKVENFTVLIAGKDLRDLDLATIKFLMIVLGIDFSK